jgi:FMN phosphatase YigB (HAD superfamily)
MVSDKVILTDCDGVMLDWVYAFDQWMKRHGYRIKAVNDYDIGKRYDVGYAEKKRLTRMFNESASIRKIPPLRDAIKYIRKLHEEHGYVFHVITSLSDNEYAQHLRTKNLCETFGHSVFEKYVYLDCGADKDEALEKYRDSGCYWVEDKPENADVGCKIGLNSVIMGHGYNVDYKGDALRVQNWKEIYQLITGN